MPQSVICSDCVVCIFKFIRIICFSICVVPEDFSYDPVSKSYGEPQRRPEIRSATIEFVAPSEYMVSFGQQFAHLQFLLRVQL